MLELFAGPQARKTIQEQGFKQALFSTMLGPSCVLSCCLYKAKHRYHIFNKNRAYFMINILKSTIINIALLHIVTFKIILYI